MEFRQLIILKKEIIAYMDDKDRKMSDTKAR